MNKYTRNNPNGYLTPYEIYMNEKWNIYAKRCMFLKSGETPEEPEETPFEILPSTTVEVGEPIIFNASELALVKAKTEQLTFTDPNRVDASTTGGGGSGDATLAKQNDMIDKLKAMMSKVYTMLTSVGTFDPATDSLEAIRERIEQTNIIPVSSVCCRVYEYCFMPDGVTPVASVSGEAEVVSLPENTGTMLITGQIIKPVYDSSTGLLYWDLTIGSSVEFNLSAFGYVNYVKTIPDASAVRLSAII